MVFNTKASINLITQCCIEHTLPYAGFELTTIVVIETDCTTSNLSYDHDNDGFLSVGTEKIVLSYKQS
jgi:hypothetical protein